MTTNIQLNLTYEEKFVYRVPYEDEGHQESHWHHTVWEGDLSCLEEGREDSCPEGDTKGGLV